MYGKVQQNGKVVGDDGKEYMVSADSCGLPVMDDAEVYVAFNSIESDSGHRTAQVTHVISPRPVNRDVLASCVDSWDQEAARDSGTFVPTDAYREIAGNRKCFVIGRKGVGKSALVRALIKEGRPGGVFSFEAFDFDQVYKLGASSFTQARYKPIWVILFITSAISVLLASDKLPDEVRARLFKAEKNSKSSAAAGFFRFINESLEKPHFDAAGDVIAAALTAVGAVLPVNPFKVASAVVGFINDRLSAPASADDAEKSLVRLQEEMVEFYLELGDKPEVVIAFDQLDEEYREKNAKEYPELIESLFSASTWLLDNMTTASGCGLGIKPVVILRDDIFETQFATTNKAKYLSYIVRPEWDKSTLQEVIAARLSQATGSGADRAFEDLWVDVFVPFYPSNPNALGSNQTWGRSVEYYSSYECFVRHTSRTPRDVIELLKECMVALRKKNNSGKSRCDYHVFIQARKEFASYYYEQVIDGMRTVFPNITRIFEAIKDEAQSPTMGRERFTDLIMNIIQPHENAEDSQINGLFEAFSKAGSEEDKALILERIRSLRSRMTSRIDAQVRELLKMLWDVCAIGLHVNNSYRAKHLNYEGFSVKAGEQIVFHPALAVHWNMDTSIIGNPLQDRDNKRETNDAPKFLRNLLLDPTQRQRIAQALKGKLWELRLDDDPDPYRPAKLVNKSFPNNIFCENRHLPDGLKKNGIFESELVIASDPKYQDSDPKKWNFYLKGAEPSADRIGTQGKYTAAALNDPTARLVIENELRSRHWEMTVMSKVGKGTLFLSHPDFPQNVYCPHKVLTKQRLALAEGDKVTAMLTINQHNERWGYIVAHIKQ
jgi:hypothetical protein